MDNLNSFVDNQLQVDIKELTFLIEPLFLKFDGVNDFSDMTSRLIT